jgi:Tfp pilus assembly protein PilZ
MSELRRHPRKSVKAQFRCRDESGTGELFFDSGDLSAGGAFLVSDLLLEQDDNLTLELSLPGGAPLRCEARVAWVRRFPTSDQAAGMGVEFRDVTEFDQRALEAFLEK